MFTLLKWIAVAFIAGLLWLVGGYIAEYFAYSSYKKYTLPKFN